MSNTERIIAEIRRLKKDLDGYSAEEALDYIESYINIIYQEHPSLPSNLDEAALQWFDSVKFYSNLSGTPINAFKAGAEWMAVQGVSYQDTISADKTIPVLPMKDVSDMGLDYSDEVVVQIRKKQ